MTGTVAELNNLLQPNGTARQIANMWSNYYTQRRPWIEEIKELRNYIFATDTSTTSNATLPWKNSTTLPKLCQLRDNLHSNYISALFPNDDWQQWEAYSREDATIDKKNAIQAYMSNKTRESKLRNVASQLLLDYIDTGNAFVETEYVEESKLDVQTGEVIPGYVGPRAVRISPYDIVFNPTASQWDKSFKIVRSILTLGELQAISEDQPEQAELAEAVRKTKNIRMNMGGFSTEDFDKSIGYAVDGFGSLQEYYGSGYVEVLRFEGDFHDEETGELKRNMRIKIIDRTHIILEEPMPSWSTGSSIRHVGWRLRPDNLYAMGPLANLVGMQYRIDHLENLKADVFDLIAYPPLKIIGPVKEFTWGPNEEIHIDEGGDVQIMSPDTQALNADFQIQLLETKMEEFAGAPRQAMGIRTPGEKTAFEVQSLDNAAGRIFQEKITNFEVNLLEPLLNDMLEISKRNLNTSDVVRVMDDDFGVPEFLTVTREDLTAKGKIRPIGARHFAAQSQLVQNLVGIMNSPIGSAIAPHMSSKRLARMVEDALNLERFSLIEPNVAIFEQKETMQLQQVAQQQLAEDAATPIEEPEVSGDVI